ncbi:MAG TPA: DUF2264 domain-containing protein [Verrucomicrobiae bacterium]|nr:DUF2264 domain-containing protein [Verrucomicrobiae bacterium]
MKNRREFFKQVAAVGVVGAIGTPVTESLAQSLPVSTAPKEDRDYWLSVLHKLAQPVLGNLSKRELKKNMPVEAANPADRRHYTYLEAFGRLMAGIAPWLGLSDVEGEEKQLQHQFIELARASLDAATNPDSPDFMNFNRGAQPLVDAAFLAQGILRASNVLWKPLDSRVKEQIITAFKATRKFGTPTNDPWVLQCNWVMFEAMIEAAMLTFGEPTEGERLEGPLRRILGWYVGDGVYGDGKFFHFDYYNSFVIQPMLVDVLDVLRQRDNRFAPAYSTVVRRAQRYAEVLERLIAPDGSFPSLGRSTTYRFGAFQVLAQISLMRNLPQTVRPAQVRCALTAVMRRMLEAPGTFDANGWLRIGFSGHQPSLAEHYISTGSLYLCSAALLPLGLPATDAFWRDPAARWTSQQIWSGASLPPDHALSDDKLNVEIPTLRR